MEEPIQNTDKIRKYEKEYCETMERRVKMSRLWYKKVVMVSVGPAAKDMDTCCPTQQLHICILATFYEENILPFFL